MAEVALSVKCAQPFVVIRRCDEWRTVLQRRCYFCAYQACVGVCVCESVFGAGLIATQFLSKNLNVRHHSTEGYLQECDSEQRCVQLALCGQYLHYVNEPPKYWPPSVRDEALRQLCDVQKAVNGSKVMWVKGGHRCFFKVSKVYDQEIYVLRKLGGHLGPRDIKIGPQKKILFELTINWI